MELSDEQLMLAVKRNKLDKLKPLFDRYQTRIYNYCLKSTQDREESADITQNVFIRVMKYRTSYREGHRFETWLFQIARNLIKDYFRKMKIHKDQFEEVEVLPDTYDEGGDTAYEEEKKLHRALNRLPDDKRELLLMSRFQGLKYEQIAEIRETSVSAIKVQVHRTMKQLRQAYFEINDD